MSLLFNILSRLVIAFLPRSKRLLISWLQSPSAVILEPKKIKSVTVSIVFPSIFHEEMGVSDHLTCLLRNLYAGQETTVRTVVEQQTGSKLEKECQGCILSPFLFNLNAEYTMQNARLEES